MTLDGVRRWVQEQGVVHPVLVDAKDEYLARLRPGPAGYPALYLLGPDGVVLWEGSTGRAGWEDACAAALGAALPPAPPQEAPR